MELYNGDCLEILKTIPDKSVNLVLTDPPYNVSVETKKNGKRSVNKWDKIDNYVDWCILWLKECARVLKPNGVLYMWHNDMAQIAQLMEAIRKNTNLQFISFCIWNKGRSYRAKSWANRNPDDVVLDCFMGSGSTGVACIHEDREFIGIEKDAEYFRIAKMRLEQEQKAGRQMSLL